MTISSDISASRLVARLAFVLVLLFRWYSAPPDVSCWLVWSRDMVMTLTPRNAPIARWPWLSTTQLDVMVGTTLKAIRYCSDILIKSRRPSAQDLMLLKSVAEDPQRLAPPTRHASQRRSRTPPRSARSASRHHELRLKMSW